MTTAKFLTVSAGQYSLTERDYFESVTNYDGNDELSLLKWENPKDGGVHISFLGTEYLATISNIARMTHSQWKLASDTQKELDQFPDRLTAQHLFDMGFQTIPQRRTQNEEQQSLRLHSISVTLGDGSDVADSPQGRERLQRTLGQRQGIPEQDSAGGDYGS